MTVPQPVQAPGPEFDLKSMEFSELTSNTVLGWITITDSRLLDRAIGNAERAYEDEEKRAGTIESKASTIIAALGIAAGIILGASGLLLNNADKLRLIAPWVLVILLIPYVLALALLSLALLRGMSATQVGFVARPDPGDGVRIQHGTTDSELTLQRIYLASLLVAYERNRRANDDKAGDLKDGQRWFLLAAGSLVVGALVVIVVALGIRLTAS